MGSNTGSLKNGNFLYIPTGSQYTQVLDSLQKNGFISTQWSFDLLAKATGYPSRVLPGKYKLTHGMSNYQMIRMLRSGRQNPVQFIVPKLRTLQDFIRFASKNLEADSAQLMAALSNTSLLSKYGLDSTTVMAAIMPDTYELWWTTSAEKVFTKIADNYTKFWNENRKAKASKIGLSPVQTVILASIVEEETNDNKEKDTIASVYLNRLHKGMKLQADPTARFAFGDFSIRRITSIHTNIPSPYNTYYTTGLPPGPICTPSSKTIDAVLKGTQTDYLYFCAKDDFSGSHSFAKDYATHMMNAKKFQQAMNSKNIH